MIFISHYASTLSLSSMRVFSFSRRCHTTLFSRHARSSRHYWAHSCLLRYAIYYLFYFRHVIIIIFSFSLFSYFMPPPPPPVIFSFLHFLFIDIEPPTFLAAAVTPYGRRHYATPHHTVSRRRRCLFVFITICHKDDINELRRWDCQKWAEEFSARWCRRRHYAECHLPPMPPLERFHD